MMILDNKEYDALMKTLARIEKRLDAKPHAEKPRGGAELNGTHKISTMSLTDAIEQIMQDGVMRNVGQTAYVVKRSGLCKHSVSRHSVNAILSKMFIAGSLIRVKLGHYQYKGKI